MKIRQIYYFIFINYVQEYEILHVVDQDYAYELYTKYTH